MKRFLWNQVAIVTGASGGIGRALALALAAQGAHLALAGRNEAVLQQVAQAVRALDRDALVIPTDVTAQDQVQRLVAQTYHHWGRIDLLVASAGVYIRGPLTQLTPAEFEHSLATNFYGALYAVLAALPIMRAQRAGHIVLVTSMDGRIALPLDAPYVVAKFALTGLGEALRQELYGSGIHVTTVLPGRVDTPMIEHLHFPWISPKISPEAVACATLRAIRSQRVRVVVPFQAKLLDLLMTLMPRLGDGVIHHLHLEGQEVGGDCSQEFVSRPPA